MASARYDVVIIGAGHNGLTCGAYLARAGLKTLVLERRDVIGGAAVTEEFVPGFRTSTFSYVMSLLHPKVIRDLELRELGLTVLPATDLFCPIGRDNYIVFSGDVGRTAREFSRFSRRDGAIYPEFDAYLNEAAGIVRKVLFDTPVDPSRRDLKSLRELWKLAWKYRRIGRNFYRVVDLLTMSADDYLSRWFEHGVTRAVLGYYCSIGTFAGPKTPGSAYVVLHHIMGEHEGAGGWGFIRGGMGAISEAIAESGRRHGMEIRTGAEVAKVEVAEGRATKVVTARRRAIRGAGGRLQRELQGACSTGWSIPRSCRPNSSGTFAATGRSRRPSRSTWRPRRRRASRRSTRRRADSPAPNYVHIGPDIDYLQAAYEDACHGRYSRRPFVTAVVADDGRRHAGAARQARREPVRGPCAVRTEGRDVGRRARPDSCKNVLRHDRRAGAGLQRRHHRRAVAAAAGHRAHHQHAARPHLPRRALAGAALLPAAGAALRGLPLACPRRSTSAAPRPTRAAACRAFPGTMRRARS